MVFKTLPYIDHIHDDRTIGDLIMKNGRPPYDKKTRSWPKFVQTASTGELISHLFLQVVESKDYMSRGIG